MNQKEIFSALLAAGLPLFVPFRVAFSLLDFPSERALAASVRRKTCSVQVDEFAGKKGFKLSEIAAWQAGGRGRGRPDKAAEIAAREEK